MLLVVFMLILEVNPFLYKIQKEIPHKSYCMQLGGYWFIFELHTLQNCNFNMRTSGHTRYRLVIKYQYVTHHTLHTGNLNTIHFN